MAGATGTASTAMAVLLSQQNFNLNLLISIFPEMPSIFKMGALKTLAIVYYTCYPSNSMLHMLP